MALPRCPALVTWLYRGVLRLHPRRIRSRVGMEPVLLLEDLWRDERPSGAIAQTRWLASLFGHALVSGISGHVEERRSRSARDAVSRHRWRPPMRSSDLRFAVRRLAKQPAATVVSVVTLAGAIGASLAAWTLISAVLIDPLPVADPDRLVVVGERGPTRNDTPGRLGLEHNYTRYMAIESTATFAGTAAGGPMGATVEANGMLAGRALYFATANFFDVLGVPLQLGRGFRVEEDRRGASPVAILSDRFWRTMFNRDPAVLQRTLVVNDTPVPIVGVAATGFRGVDLAVAPDAFLPLHTIEVTTRQTNWFAEENTRLSPTAWVRVIGRLRPGMRVAEAHDVLQARLVAAQVRTGQLELVDVQRSALAERVRPDMTRFARLLGFTVGSLLLIGCLTVGMLLLLRTEARRDELALCLALGASRTRLAGGIAVEGALLALAGGALALPLSRWLVDGVRAFELPGRIAIETIEVHSLAATCAVVLPVIAGVTIVIALVGGTLASTARVTDALRSRAGVTTRTARRRTRSLLVVSQVAVALVLLAGTGLFVRSLIEALSLNPGFDTTRIAQDSVRPRRGSTPAQAEAFYAELRDRLDRSPSVASVSFRNDLGGMSAGGEIAVDGVKTRMPSLAGYQAIDDRYFHTMGLPIIHGRDFTPADTASAQPVAIVSESFASFIAPGSSVLGHRIQGFSSRAPHKSIVGVVPDVVTDVRTLQPLAIYLPISQQPPFGGLTVVLRATGDMSAARSIATGIVKELDPTLVAPTFRTMEEAIARQMGPQRFGATVLGALGGIAALLTVFGIYVLAESAAVQRRREMGVRAALGATGRQLTSLMLRDTARLIAAGAALGLGLVWLGAGLIRSFLFGVAPLDASTLGIVTASMILLTIAVGLRPALRAGRVDLATLLREE